MLSKATSNMKSSSEGSSFCTLGGMTMTPNFNAMDMPVNNPPDHASESNQTLEHNATDDNTNDNHNHSSSSSTNHDDHNSMHHNDHSSHSHSMPMMSQGTVMYMDGFQSALFHNSQNPPPCLNFLHPSVRFCG